MLLLHGVLLSSSGQPYAAVRHGKFRPSREGRNVAVLGAFAVHSLEIARSAAVQVCSACGPRTKARLLVLFIRTLEASCRGLGIHSRTPQVRRCWGLRSAFSAKLVDKAGVCASQPLSDRNKGFVVIYIGGLHE